MAEYDFKTKKFVGKKSKVMMWWENKLLPAMVDLDFLFRIQFDWPKIQKDYSTHMGDFDERKFFNEVTMKNFNEKNILRQAKTINDPNFKAMYVTYKGELDVYSLNPDSKKPQQFGYTLTIESKDPKKEYDKKDMEKFMAKIILEFEKVALADGKYYKIVK